MKIGIIGPGVYGIALGKELSKYNDVLYYTMLDSEYNLLKNDYNITTDIKKIEDTDLIIIALSSLYIDKINLNIDENKQILIATKGLINGTYVKDYIYNKTKCNNISIIAGPSFANEMNDITCFTISTKSDFYKNIKTDNFKFEYIDNDKGIALCSTLKNIYAFGFGILDKCTYTTKMAFLTDCFKEMKYLFECLNIDTNILFSYAGIGDFVLTTTSSSSRNYTFGKMLALKEDINEFKKTNTIECISNINELKSLIKDIDLKIINILYNVIKDENTSYLDNYFN